MRWAGSIAAIQEHRDAVKKSRQRPKPKITPPKPRKKKYGDPPWLNGATEETGYACYRDYLHSRWWYFKRNQKLDSVNRRCARCRSRKNLEVHHLHYRTLWHERHTDLEVLCRTCHEAVHTSATR